MNRVTRSYWDKGWQWMDRLCHCILLSPIIIYYTQQAYEIMHFSCICTHSRRHHLTLACLHVDGPLAIHYKWITRKSYGIKKYREATTQQKLYLFKIFEQKWPNKTGWVVVVAKWKRFHKRSLEGTGQPFHTCKRNRLQVYHLLLQMPIHLQRWNKWYFLCLLALVFR